MDQLQSQSRVAFRETEYYTYQKMELARSGNIAALLAIRVMEAKIIGSLGRPMGAYRPAPILEFVSYDADALSAIELLSRQHSINEIFQALYNSYIFAQANIAIVYNLSQSDSEIVFAFVKVSDKYLMSGTDSRLTESKSSQILHQNSIDINHDIINYDIKNIYTRGAVPRETGFKRPRAGRFNYARLRDDSASPKGYNGNLIAARSKPVAHTGSANESLFGGYKAGTMDTMFAGSGNTLIKSNADDDKLIGGTGDATKNDESNASGGGHTLVGGSGKNTLFSGATGDDALRVMMGNNHLDGNGVVFAGNLTWELYEHAKACVHLNASNLRCGIDALPPVATPLPNYSFGNFSALSAFEVLNIEASKRRATWHTDHVSRVGATSPTHSQFRVR